MLSGTLFSLAFVIIHCMRDTVSTKKANCIFVYPLFLTNTFHHFNVDLFDELGEKTNSSDIISSLTISRSCFEYDEEENKWLTKVDKYSKRGERETFGFEFTRPPRHPSKVVAEEEDKNEDYEVVMRSTRRMIPPSEPPLRR